MKREGILHEVRRDVLSGALAWLPILGAIALFYWGFTLVRGALTVLNRALLHYVTLNENIVTLLSMAIVLVVFIVTGRLLRNMVVRRAHSYFESVLKKLPGIGSAYKTIKEPLTQFLGGKKTPLERVAGYRDGERVRLGYLTSVGSEMSSILVPTSPSPPNGIIDGIENGRIFELPNIHPGEFMRSILFTGAGYAEYLDEFYAIEQGGYTLADRIRDSCNE